jgi:hypothetical protein
MPVPRRLCNSASGVRAFYGASAGRIGVHKGCAVPPCARNSTAPDRWSGACILPWWPRGASSPLMRGTGILCRAPQTSLCVAETCPLFRQPVNDSDGHGANHLGLTHNDFGLTHGRNINQTPLVDGCPLPGGGCSLHRGKNFAGLGNGGV